MNTLPSTVRWQLWIVAWLEGSQSVAVLDKTRAFVTREDDTFCYSFAEVTFEKVRHDLLEN